MTNIYQDKRTSSWIVEFRYEDEREWTRIYEGADRAEAYRIFNER